MATLRIVLTGGPGAGKSCVSSALAQRWPERYARVGEAASLVYEAMGTRWDLLDVAGRREVQRRIYRLQIEQEERALREHPGKVLLLDRGTVDGAAYWPEGPADYWLELGTNEDRELARYDGVIWMQTSAVIPGAYDREASNPHRYEPEEAAIASGNLLKLLWGKHPRLVEVGAFMTVGEKVTAVAGVLKGKFSVPSS